ncbi:MAG: type II toxin-antitoxin system RelE/ParE family toxin [Candidatus Woesearchaeota archaeon]
MFEKISRKVSQVVQKPEMYKILLHVGGRYRRVHVGSFVLLFTIEKKKATFLGLEHHDSAYRRK